MVKFFFFIIGFSVNSIFNCCPSVWLNNDLDSYQSISFLAAAFWSDVDTIGTGTVWSRRTTNETAVLNKKSSSD